MRMLILLLLSIYGCNAQNVSDKLKSIKLPEGFQISVYASGVQNARSMTLGEKGTLFVGSRSANKVYAITDADNNGKADEVKVLSDELSTPNGVAYYKGDLYVAEISKVWKFTGVENNLKKTQDPVLVNDSFPSEGHHGWKYIAFGPDSKLYVPVGAPCNICDDSKQDRRFASIMRMNRDGSGLEVYAEGVRNTVGFAWHPETKDLWFTDNGGDNLGDNIPPDELNSANKKGMNFGYPYCHAGQYKDPKYGNEHSCAEFVSPEVKLGPHVAALGMKFYTGRMFPAEYKNKIFIAEHGSWNRSEPIGYRISIVDPVKKSYTTFASGFMSGGEVWGRPVDVLQLPDGSLLVSDDKADCIYRITYNGK